MVAVVYVAWGPRRVVETAVFSALTLIAATTANTPPWRLIVYTDRPELFARYGIECELPPLEQVGDSSDGGKYLYRPKILALRHCAANYEGDMLFLDGDTYFERAPDELFTALSEGRSIMHTKEYTLSETAGPELHHMLRTEDFESAVLRAAGTQRNLEMWNSGVIGIPSTSRHVIDPVLEACDEIYRCCGLRVAEQLAWALALAQTTDVRRADDAVHHYWAAREQVMYDVVRFLHARRRLPMPELARQAFALRPVPTAAWTPPPALRARMLVRSARNATRSMRRLVTGPLARARAG
jgi:hypothetical protein